MNYSAQYQRFHRTDITISAKSLSIFVSPHLNWVTRTPPKLGDSVTQLRLSLKDWTRLNPQPPIRGIFFKPSYGRTCLRIRTTNPLQR